jgi:phage tail-like protein
MSRTAVLVPSPYRLGELLPAMYADDDFAQRLTAGLDAVLAPVLSTVDNLAAYLDPDLTPVDFLAYLASWVGVRLEPAWPLAARRAVVGRAVALHRLRGTGPGLVERLWLCLGVYAQVLDGPGATWSATPDTELPGSPVAEVVVRVWPGPSGVLDPDQVGALVAASCPAHLRCVVEPLAGPPAEEGG